MTTEREKWKEWEIEEEDLELTGILIIEEEDNVKEIENLRINGHTHHCACRIVWGDGECECNKVIRTPYGLSGIIDIARRTDIVRDSGIIVVHRDASGEHDTSGDGKCRCDPFIFPADTIKTTDQLLEEIRKREVCQ